MRLPQSLQWRIALAYMALITVSMGVVTAYLISFIRSSYLNELEHRVMSDASLIAETVLPLLAEDTRRYPEVQAIIERIQPVAGGPVTLILPGGQLIAQAGMPAPFTGNISSLPETATALNGRIGVSYRAATPSGIQHLFVAAPVQSGSTVLGAVQVAVPTASVGTNLRQIISTLLIAGALVTLLTVALAFYLARRTSRALQAVTQGVERLAQGDLEHRLESGGPGETVELSHALNAMAERLRENIHDLTGEKNKLTALLNTMADGVVVLDARGSVELINPAANRLLGLSDRSTSQWRFVDRVRDHDLHRLVTACTTAREPKSAEVDLLHLNKVVAATATPLLDILGVRVLLTLHDLTESRLLASTRREFASNVSHELRTPIASIKALAETLRMGALDDPDAARGFVARIEEQANRMATLVDALLDLSRIESGNEALYLQRVAIAPLVEDVLGQFKHVAEQKGVSLVNEVPTDLPPVQADPEKLRQVLNNLIDNAIKFTPPGGRVAVSAAVSGRMGTVTVRDTGVGIAPEHLPHIFERFYKVDRSRRGGGTGLGLAIAKHIVQAHGGAISVDSQEGSGSSFSFTIPFSDN
jgi:two-component system phosphate regulon sensor histidine kinase PhoR